MNLSHPHMPQTLLEQYLRLLGVPRRPPGMAGLCDLIRAHLRRVPFENISKLFYRGQPGGDDIPTLERFLDGIERFNFGGTCYTTNYYFYQLLANLGYQVTLCGADMTRPDVHAVILIQLEAREYLVDVGYAAPFITPLPRDLTRDHILVHGRDRYVLRAQDGRGRSRMDLYRDGQLEHGYLVKPMAKKIADFRHAISASFRPEATFMNAILLARFDAHQSLIIHNTAVIETEGEQTRMRTAASRDELVKNIESGFGISAEVSMEVLGDLNLSGDAWS